MEEAETHEISTCAKRKVLLGKSRNGEEGEKKKEGARLKGRLSGEKKDEAAA